MNILGSQNCSWVLKSSLQVDISCNNRYLVNIHRILNLGYPTTNHAYFYIWKFRFLDICRRMLEKNVHPHPMIHLRGVNFAILRSVIQFIYMGQTEVEVWF